jgi:hypothetical protein
MEAGAGGSCGEATPCGVLVLGAGANTVAVVQRFCSSGQFSGVVCAVVPTLCPHSDEHSRAIDAAGARRVSDAAAALEGVRTVAIVDEFAVMEKEALTSLLAAAKDAGVTMIARCVR